MKILFVNEKCGYFGGVEQNVVDTAQGMKDRRHSCYLLSGSKAKNGEAYRNVFEKSWEIPELFFPNGKEKQDPHKALAKICNDVQPDVVYVHKIQTIQGLGDIFDKIYTVRMVHDHDLCCPRRHKYFLMNGRVCHHPAGWRCWLDGAFLERANRPIVKVRLSSIQSKIAEMRANRCFRKLLVGSHFMAEELRMNGFASEKIRIVPPVVSSTALACPETGLPKSGLGTPMILYVGQLIRGKGVDLLLHAFSKMRQPFQAKIVGSGNAQGHLERLSHKLGLDRRVHFIGWVDHDRIGQFYQEASVFVMPSRWPEPFGMVGLEAMQNGLPVVAFTVGGIPDWLTDAKTGFLIPEQDTVGFANALDRLLSDRDSARRLGQNGHDRVKEKYSFQNYMEELEKIFHEGLNL